MAREEIHELAFPFGGLHRALSYQHEPPFTTPEACNVRPRDTATHRQRGGSRPGLDQAFYLLPTGGPLGAPSPIRMAANVTVAKSTGYSFWEDDFIGATIGGDWEKPSWETNLPPVIAGIPVTLVGLSGIAKAGAIRKILMPVLDPGQAYSAQIYIVPWQAKHHGKYRLWAGLEDTPALTTNGLQAELTMTGATGAWTGELKQWVGGVMVSITGFTAGASGTAQSGWFTMVVNGLNVKCFWRDTLICDTAVVALAGTRMGFGLECTTASGGLALVDMFRAQWYSNYTAERRRILVTSAGGSLYREPELGRLELVPSDSTIAADRLIRAAAHLHKLYIADYDDDVVEGTDGQMDATGLELSALSIVDWTALWPAINIHDDVCVITEGMGTVVNGTYQITGVAVDHLALAPALGTGSCAYEIRRGPKVYDAAANTLNLWFADTGKGQVPTSCPFICLYRDRITMAKNTNWYMSRQSDPYDWDMTGPITDVGRAFRSGYADQSMTEDDITALAPYENDYLIFGCEYSLWVMRGDPAYGGQIDSLDRDNGIVGAKAWCYGPSGEFYFLARAGLFVLAPKASGVPQPISEIKIPQELKNINHRNFVVHLEYDFRARGVHIFVTKDLGETYYYYGT